jgi:D-alanyl-D-alanine carboxypeptidase
MDVHPSVTERIARFADRMIAAHATPGVAVALTDRDRLLAVVLRGHADPAAGRPVTEDTRFEIGSISKSFTAICLLREVEEGRLSLDDRVAEHLPWFPLGDRTVRQLLTHTGGLVMGLDALPASPQTVLDLRDAPRVEPGRFWYSNVGYQSLGYLLEQITGEPFGETYRRRIMEPLGMRSTSPVITDALRGSLAVGHVPGKEPWRPGEALVTAPWVEYGSADGSVASTAGDLAAYLRMFLNRGAGVLDEASFDELTRDAVDDGEGGAYALGVEAREVDGRPWIGHSGGMVGYHSRMWGAAEERLGCVAFINGRAGPSTIAEYGLRLLLDPDTPEPAIDDLADPAAGIELDRYPPAAWAGRTGTYRSFSPWLASVRVTTAGGAPLLILEGQVFKLVELEDGTYRIGEEQHSPERLRFDQPLGDRTHRLWYSTAPYVRTFTG